MDRLSPLKTGSLILTLLLALPAGCDDAPTAAPPSRVEAVTASETRVDPRTDLCEVVRDGSNAPLLALPPLAEGQTAPTGSGKRWLNIWATWCHPCVEEMPALVALHDRMREDAPFELVFVSVDESDEAIATFRSEHPSLPETLRVSDPAAIATWASSVGLDEGATLPIHVLTDASGRVRCARTGGLSTHDLALAEEALRAL